jgi:hypothetical protein
MATVSRLIAMLSEYGDDEEVQIFDPESRHFENVTGLVHDPKNKVIELWSDSEDMVVYRSSGETV